MEMLTQAVARASVRAAAQDHVLTLCEAYACGLDRADVRRFLRSGRWRRLHTAVFLVDAHTFDDVPRRTLLRAALKRHGDDAVLWGASAAEVYGLAGSPAGRPWVLLPFGQERHQDGTTRLRFRDGSRIERWSIRGFPVTPPLQTLADLVAIVDRLTGLSVLDSALHEELVTPSGLTVVNDLCAGRRGALKVRELVALADGRAASPLESRVRLRAHDGGVPPDELQWPVRDRHGIVVAVGDMAWLRNRSRPLIGEADGEGPHSRVTPLFRDRHRQNDVVIAEVDVIRFTWADTRMAAYIPSTVKRSLRAA